MSHKTKSSEEILAEFEKRYGKIESYYHADGAYVPEGKEAMRWLQSTLALKDTQKEEVVREIIKMADALELECGLDGDKGTAQWMAFKCFRNSIRDKFLTTPLPESDKQN